MIPRISIIMPVYNSIINQTFTDFELIAVNDGSTDSSLSILHDYSKRDSRIIVIDKPNTGVSDTRNLGLSNAQGEYVCFVDADDILEIDYLKDMYQIAKEYNLDIVLCENCLINKRGVIRELNFGNNTSSYLLLNGNNLFCELLSRGLGIQVWNKLIRKEILISNLVLFDSSMTYDEDMFFSWKAVLCSSELGICCHSLYRYRLTPCSAICKYHEDLLTVYNYQFNELRKFAKRIEKYDSKLEDLIKEQYCKKIPIITGMVVRSGTSYSIMKKSIKTILADSVIQECVNNQINKGDIQYKGYLPGNETKVLLLAIFRDIKNKFARIIY